jgi:hypothetical protein
VNKKRTARARNVNNVRTVFVPFLIVVLTMTGIVFWQAYQLRRQIPTEPTVTVADSAPLEETNTVFSFAKPLIVDTSFVAALTLVPDSAINARRLLVSRWQQLNKAGDKLTEKEMDAIARGDTIVRTGINYWGVRKDTLRLFWDEGKQKLGWQ